ncbi:PKD domain-containing protein [Microbacterium sp. 4R-513]|uniref:PKD domain-containing protein n=1 Tax=Microbacterium sp. 4R-513 TaxID=2567934 RepID=UPI0013E14EB5|nr:PKD domain-containing protein [Microbacterium sp. 4R-513]QIG38805.1 PKD domain-containing protein [Microbacterium sp. 4R-513]
MSTPTRRTHRRRELAIAVTWGLIAGSLSIAFAPPANAAPPVVALVSPSDGSTVGTSAELKVSVSDPDGDPATVTFEGRRQGLTVPGPTDEDPFTLVVLPDTQNYTYNNRQSTMNRQAQWIVDNSARLGVAFTMQVGDLVSEYTNPTQWSLTSAALGILDAANQPNSVVPGNHDFDNATGAVGPYDTYFPVSRYAQAGWNTATTKYGGYLGQNQFGPDPVDRKNFDSYSLFTAGGTDFLVLNLEWEAPGYALDWADRVLDAYPDRTVVMVTHSFLTVSGSRWTGTQRPGGTSQASLWNDFVSTHCQIRIVISGHEHNGDEGEASRTDPNTCGKPVHQLMTDYQDRANGGDGWLRYYTFDPAANTMTATTYSPTLDRYETDANSSFVLPFELTPPAPAPFETIGTSSVVGGTASATWAGLAADTAYEWRAVVHAGTDTVTSPTFTLRAGASAPRLTDSFTRTAASGWGTAETGQAWVPTSSASSFSVDGANGRITVAPGQGRSVDATVFRSTDLAVATELSPSVAPGGSGAYVSLLGRDIGASDYRATVQLSSTATVVTLRRVLNGAETILGTQRIGNGVAAGASVKVRFELSGTSPTTLRAKAWTGGTEPSAWSLTSTDASAALQTSGGVGAYVYLSGSAGASVTTLFPDYSAVGQIGAPPPPVNQPPTAVIATPTISGRTVSVSGAGSTDPDGTIASWAWTFGDGTTATGATATRTYAADGTYTISLTVTDDKGATHTTTRSVTVAAPVNQPPTAVIATPTISGRTVSVSGGGSTDPDGTIASWAWTFGDGTTATGATATRTYAADGTYTISLTVTDDKGATHTTTRSVTVAAPPQPPSALVADDFGRTVANGWGTADVGGAWTLTGTASRFAVANGVGAMTLTTAGTSAQVEAAAARATSSEVRLSVSWDRTSAAGSLYTVISPRAVSSSADYRLKVYVSGTIPYLDLIRRSGGVETLISRTALGIRMTTPGAWYSVAVRATTANGATTLSAKLWPQGTTEPAAWQATATDATAALQASGSMLLWTYMSSSATAPVKTSFDDIRFTAVGP